MGDLNRARNMALAFLLTAGLSLPATGLAYAVDDSENATSKAKDKLSNLFTDGTEDNRPAKSESVYVFASADGSVKSTVVTDWLKNTTGAARLHDISSLSDIQNTEGEETFEAKGQSLVWDAQGNDIYYQGNTDKAVPVVLMVTYWLDGKEIAPTDLTGKSGHVKIRFDYRNNSHSVEYVDGAARTVYTPFVCITGMVLDNNVFKNVSTTNAKALNDGDRTFIGGYALPGLQANLDLDADDLELPDYFEIEADVEGFEMGATATLVSSSLFDNLNTDELDTSEIGDALHELSDAMGQLVDGTSALYDGMKKLDEGGKKLASGAAKLADNTAALPESTKKLADGGNALAEGTGSLAEGVDALANGLGDATNGTEALVAGNEQISAGLNRLANGATDGEGNKTAPGLKDAAEGAEQIKDGISALAADEGALDQFASAQTGLASNLAEASEDIAQYATNVDAVKDTLSQTQASLDDASSALSGLGALASIKGEVGDNKQAADETAAAAQAVVETLEGVDLESIEDEQLKSIILKAQSDAEASSEAANQAAETAGQLSSDAASMPDAQTITGLADIVAGLSSDVTTAIGNLDAAVNGDGSESNPGLNGVSQSLTSASQEANALVGQIADVKTGLAGAANSLDSLGSGLDSAVRAIGSSGDSAAKQGENATLLGGNNDVTSGLKSLSSGLGTAETGASQLASGANKVDKGANTLAQALTELSKAAPALAAGIEALNGGTSELSAGIGAAADGTKKLAQGIAAFNDEGIQKILDAYHDSLDGLTGRIKATAEAGKRYDTFSGKSDGMKGSVKFIYETDAIEIPED